MKKKQESHEMRLIFLSIINIYVQRFKYIRDFTGFPQYIESQWDMKPFLPGLK